MCRVRQYTKAADSYLLLSIGKAAWPMGVTMVGIHERSSREKIFSSVRVPYPLQTTASSTGFSRRVLRLFHRIRDPEFSPPQIERNSIILESPRRDPEMIHPGNTKSPKSEES
jgi:hypothetical protein